MATNMPPHNLGEIIDGVCAQIDNPEHHRQGIDEARQRAGFSDRLHGLRYGRRSKIISRRAAAAESARQSGLEQLKGGREQIVITEIPFNVNRAVLVERIARVGERKDSHGYHRGAR